MDMVFHCFIREFNCSSAPGNDECSYFVDKMNKLVNRLIDISQLNLPISKFLAFLRLQPTYISGSDDSLHLLCDLEPRYLHLLFAFLPYWGSHYIYEHKSKDPQISWRGSLKETKKISPTLDWTSNLFKWNWLVWLTSFFSNDIAKCIFGQNDSGRSFHANTL